MARKTPEGERLLTEVELELMHIVWRLGESSVADVLGALPPERPLAYTSVSTILRILEQKGVVSSRKEGRGHIYLPVLTRERYEATSLRHLVKTLFDGTPERLVRRLIEDEGISPGELDSLKKLLDKE